MHDHARLNFPSGFLWGAATSAFQVEGNITHSDWWQWEQTNQSPSKRSGKASNQYELYEQDFDLARKLGHNSHRLSLEWSRIEPNEGEFDLHEIEHYKKVLMALKQRGIKVMLTLHHFSNPAWFAQKGGWVSIRAPFYFERFVQRVVPEIKNYVDYWITINEPGVYTYLSYITKEFPPQQKSLKKALMVMWNMARAHNKAYRLIHSLTKTPKVGVAHSVASYDIFHHHSILENIEQFLADIITNHLFMILTGKINHDFIGLNYYMNQYISQGTNSSIPKLVDIRITQKEVSDLGWEIYPEGIFDIIMDFQDYKLPIYITENGIATTNDDRRVRFLISYLKEIHHAIAAGADVRGYFYWSLIDNMELHRGFDPKFGLIEVNFKNQKRIVRPSAYVYKKIIQENGISHKLLKLLGHGIKVKEVIKI